MNENYTGIMSILEEQEKLLRIDRFSGDFALEFGCLMAKRAKEKGVAIGISIRKIDGAVIFQYMPDGANTVNTDNWLRRKSGTVIAFEHSSLYMWAHEQATGQTVQYNGFDPMNCVQRGGAFPLILKSGEFVGVAAVSGLAHYEDHQFIVDSLAEYLGAGEVPAVHLD